MAIRSYYDYDTRAIVLSFMSVGTVGPLLLMALTPYLPSGPLDFMTGRFVWPSGRIWGYIVAMGLFATLAQLYMTKAYGETKAGIVGAVSYANIVFSVAIGLLLGDAFPEMLTIFGIILIIFSGTAVRNNFV